MLLSECCSKALPIQVAFLYNDQEEYGRLLATIRKYNHSANLGVVRLPVRSECEEISEFDIPHISGDVVGSPIVFLRRRRLQEGGECVTGCAAVGYHYLETFFRDRGHYVEEFCETRHEHVGRTVSINMDGIPQDRPCNPKCCLGSLWSPKHFSRCSIFELGRLLRFVGWPISYSNDPHLKHHLESTALYIMGFQRPPAAIPTAVTQARLEDNVDIDGLVAEIEAHDKPSQAAKKREGRKKSRKARNRRGKQDASRQMVRFRVKRNLPEIDMS